MKVPTNADLVSAWLKLPQLEADRIGLLAVRMVFQGFLAGNAQPDADRVMRDPAARATADDQSNESLTQIYTVIENALPELFGPTGESPAWAKRSEGATDNG